MSFLRKQESNLDPRLRGDDTYKFYTGLFLIIFLSLILLICGWNQPDAFELQDIEAAYSPSGDKIILYTNTWIEPREVYNKEEHYLKIVFRNTWLKVKDIPSIDSSRIEKIKFSRRNKDTILHILLSRDSQYDIVNIFGRNKIEIEFYHPETEMPKAWKAPVSAESISTSLKDKKIMLDAGHGGNDPGAISATGTYEKSLTLKTALKLRRTLMQSGARVYLTRTRDLDNDYRETTEMANKIGIDLLISVHYNYYRDSSINGCETYYYSRTSQKLAQIIQKNMVKNIRLKDRGIKHKTLYIIHHANMPAILIEPAYISNRHEAFLVKTDDFQNKLVKGIIEGLKEYYQGN